MRHETHIVEVKELSNGQHAVLITCCGSHQHWHTMANSVAKDSQRLKESLDIARNLAAAAHQERLDAKANLADVKGSKQAHELN